MYFYEPAHGHGLAHDPLNSIVAPRPIGWIASLSAEGVANLAPYSFFNLFNYRPPILGFASVGWKDSVANIAATKAFTWNLASKALAEPMNATSASHPPEVDEFVAAGLDKVPSRLVPVPRVAAALVSFECVLTQLVRLERQDGQPLDSWLVLGEVVGVHMDEALIVDGHFRTVDAHPILRGGGPAEYFEAVEACRFEMERPE